MDYNGLLDSALVELANINKILDQLFIKCENSKNNNNNKG